MSVEDIQSATGTSMDRDVFRRVLRYPMLLFKLCGCYVELGTDGHFGPKQIALLVYSIILTIFVWVDNVRYMIAMSLEAEIERLMSMAVVMIDYLVKSFYLTYCLRVLTTKMPDIYEKFQIYQQSHRLGVDIRRWEKNVRILCRCLVVYNITVFAACIIANNVTLLSEKSLLHKVIFPFYTKYEGRLVILGAVLVMTKAFIVSLFHHCFYLFYYLVCQILHLEFQKSTKDLKMFIENIEATEMITDGKKSIETYRKHHSAMTDLMNSVNDVIQHMAGMHYGISLTVLCVILYGFAHGKLVAEDIVILSSSVIFYCVIMIHLTFSAASLNKEAHSSYDVLYHVNTEELPVKTVLQIQMFLSRLKGPAIGINLYGLFSIDRTTILMLIGTLLTYGVIVLQSAPHQGNTPPTMCPTYNTSSTLT